jgi:hypothetical protein
MDSWGRLDFEELVEALTYDGYDVSITDEVGFDFAYVTGNGIVAGFCTPHGDVYPYLNWKIAADAAWEFDKWSKCPLVMDLPVDYDELLDHLDHLGSREDYLNYSYPYEMY